MTKRILLLTILMVILSLSGCSGKVVHMKEADKNAVIQAPDKGQSLIVFVRTGVYGVAKQTSIFEIIDNRPHLVGILASGKKVAYTTTPGEHIFMAVGSGLDSTLMSATLSADKTYYIDTDIVGGVWGVADVIFIPMTDDENIKSKLDECQLVELNNESLKWADENSDDLNKNYIAANEAWLDTDEEDRAKLVAEDGK